jgi:hypothetical protein
MQRSLVAALSITLLLSSRALQTPDRASLGMGRVRQIQLHPIACTSLQPTIMPTARRGRVREPFKMVSTFSASTPHSINSSRISRPCIRHDGVVFSRSRPIGSGAGGRQCLTRYA